MPSVLGLACHWGADRRRTWSGTPYALDAALRARMDVIDVDLTLPDWQRLPLTALAARRHDGSWQAKWRHGRAGTAMVQRRLQKATTSLSPDVVVEIGDLGRVDTPYAVLQDLSYSLLLDHFGAAGVPHFRTLTRRRIAQLRERQHDVYAGARWLLPMSRWLADRCIADGVPEHRVHVVHPGVNAPLPVDAPVPERRRGDVRRLLFVGRDFDTKAGDQVVAAFRELRADLGRGIELTVAGPRRWSLERPPDDGIRYLGPVPAASVAELIDSHDLFVMPSRFEGFGIAFIEALVRGLPCIGRDTCAMPEIITPSDGGLLVTGDSPRELAETVLLALNDDDLYQRCAQAAPRRRAYYTWERAADQILASLGMSTHSPSSTPRTAAHD